MSKKMAQEPTFFQLKALLPLPESEAENLLGRIVKNFKAPWVGSVPRKTSAILEGCVKGSTHDFKLEKQTSNEMSLTARLRAVFGVNLIASTESQFDLNGKKIFFQLIREQDIVFERLKRDAEVIARVPPWIKFRGPPVCLITGLLMYEDATIGSSQKQATEVSGQGTVPVGQAVGAVHGVPVTSSQSSGDIAIQGKAQRQNADIFQGRGEGRKIFALEVKQVTTGFLHREDLRLKDEVPNMPKDKQLSGDVDDLSGSDSDDSGPDMVGTKRELEKKSKNLEVMNDLTLVSVDATGWGRLYSSLSEDA